MAFLDWRISEYEEAAQRRLCAAGVSPLLAALLCARGYDTPEQAARFLRDDIGLLHDPLRMKDMDLAVARIRAAAEKGEHVAVYGDYDVDGLTSSALMTSYLRSLGLPCETYIPERLTEGYGISEEALRGLHAQGVTLLVTVDCGITAVEQVELAASLGMDVVITDHHECGQTLPRAAAVVDPHRPDCGYPFKGLAGVGVAFKLVCALEGSAEAVLSRYGALAAIGTIADIMPTGDENRAIVRQGLSVLRRGGGRLGLRYLMRETGILAKNVTGVDISFTLVPKLNAAGRMGKVRLAFDLLMTTSEKQAAELAVELCNLNQERRTIENRIFNEAMEMIEAAGTPDAPIVLASEHWHQGVSGIVASRLTDRFGLPAVIICIEEGEGRGSCRSCAGFNLFSALESIQDKLLSFGGHELAAGITLEAGRVDEVRQALRGCWLERSCCCAAQELGIDFEVRDPALLTLPAIEALDRMEPWGSGNPPPLLCIRRALVESVTPIGGDKHLKMRIRKRNQSLDCIFFSKTVRELGLRPGVLADIAFQPGINEFRGNRSVQLLLRDARPSALAEGRELELCRRYRQGETLSAGEKRCLAPSRADCVRVWKYLSAGQKRFTRPGGELFSDMADKTGSSAGRCCASMLVFEELGLLSLRHDESGLSVEIPEQVPRVDLNQSKTMAELRDHGE